MDLSRFYNTSPERWTDEEFISIVNEFNKHQSITDKIEFLFSMSDLASQILIPSSRAINDIKYTYGFTFERNMDVIRAGQIYVDKYKYRQIDSKEQEIIDQVIKESHLVDTRKIQAIDERINKIHTRVKIGEDANHKQYEESKYFASGYKSEKALTDYDFLMTHYPIAFFDEEKAGVFLMAFILTADGATAFLLEERLNRLIARLKGEEQWPGWHINITENINNVPIGRGRPDEYGKEFEIEVIESEINETAIENIEHNIKENSFKDYLNIQGKEIYQYLLTIYSNNSKGPSDIVYMLYALQDLKLLNVDVSIIEKTTLYNSLIASFGNFGRMQYVSEKINEFEQPQKNTDKINLWNLEKVRAAVKIIETKQGKQEKAR